MKPCPKYPIAVNSASRFYFSLLASSFKLPNFSLPTFGFLLYAVSI